MIVGTVTSDGVPIITIAVAGRDWPAIVDTGFNGDLELPLELRDRLTAEFAGQIESLLAGGQRILEDAYLVAFPFDGQILKAGATFVEGETILLGTRLLGSHRLEIVFPRQTLVLERLK